MRINDILTEDQLDELNLKGLGTGLGDAVGAVGGGIAQGAKNIWNGMKQGYQKGQAALAPDTDTTNQPTTQPATTSQTVSVQDQGTANDIDMLRKKAAIFTKHADELEKLQQTKSATNTNQEVQPAVQAAPAADNQQPAPTGTTTTIDPNAAANKLAKGQADQQQAIQQMQQTAANNAATSAADNDLVARVKAEKAKPGYDQDKGLLRRAAAQGIHENKKKKKKVAEFHSRFLGIEI